MDSHDTRDGSARAEQTAGENVFERWLGGDHTALDALRLSSPYGEREEKDGEERAGRSEAEPGTDEPSLYLESSQKYCAPKPGDTVPAQHIETHCEIHSCKCKTRFCKHCCTGMGLRLYHKILPVVATFTHLQMWTFTIDPTLFDSSEEAYLYVRDRRAISLLIGKLFKLGHLHTRRFFSVLEWQKNGMVHYHVLLDARFIPFSVVRDIWNTNRPKCAGPVEGERPGFGSIQFSPDLHCFDSPEHAAHYACKYLIKHPSHGYPRWVLDFQGTIRRYATSRGFFPEEEKDATEEKAISPKVRKDKGPQHRDDCFCPECRGDEPERTNRKRSTLRQRIAKCKDDAVVLEVRETILPDGEVIETKRFMRNLNAPFWLVEKLLNQKAEGSKPLHATRKELAQLETALRQCGRRKGTRERGQA